LWKNIDGGNDIKNLSNFTYVIERWAHAQLVLNSDLRCLMLHESESEIYKPQTQLVKVN